MEHFSFVAFLWQAFMFGLLVAWMYFLYEIVTSEFKGREGMLWSMLVFFVPLVGLLAYLVYGRGTRTVKNKYLK
ncbi:PLDc N-terminal domain-containing protein [Salinimicrobium sp. CAU 1759]